MLVRECFAEWEVDQSGARVLVQKSRMVEKPDVVTAEVQAVADAIAAQAEAIITGNDLTLREQAEAALVNLRAYRDLASPTNAQTVAAVKLLCRVCIGLIRLYLRKLDATD